MFSSINFVAVLVAALANFVIGMFWYSPALFGKKWMKLTNVDPSKADMKNAMICGTANTIFQALMLAIILSWFEPANMSQALKLGLLLFTGISLPLELSRIIWERRPMDLLYINGGHALVTYLVAIAIIQTF